MLSLFLNPRTGLAVVSTHEDGEVLRLHARSVLWAGSKVDLRQNYDFPNIGTVFLRIVSQGNNLKSFTRDP